MPAEIRRTLLHIETTFRDGGREALGPDELIVALGASTTGWPHSRRAMGGDVDNPAGV